MNDDTPLDAFVPAPFREFDDPARDLPRIAKDRSAMTKIRAAVAQVPTRHRLLLGDARRAVLPAESIHLGDTVLDPFTGTASTQVAAACGRNTLGIEVDPVYYGKALARLRTETASLLRSLPGAPVPALRRATSERLTCPRSMSASCADCAERCKASCCARVAEASSPT